MTTIVWDGQTLAADKRTSFGGVGATTTKLYRINGALVGCAGATAQIAELLEWFRDGRDPKTFPTLQRSQDDCVSALVITPKKEIHQYENTPYPIVLENRQWAIGSGRDFALAALLMGKSAYEAVEIASVLDRNTGHGIDTLTLDPQW